MITNLYIDGFNLYYRALKDTPFRWLDLHKLAETLFPEDTINRVCYFTARLDTRPGNQGQLHDLVSEGTDIESGQGSARRDLPGTRGHSAAVQRLCVQ